MLFSNIQKTFFLSALLLLTLCIPLALVYADKHDEDEFGDPNATSWEEDYIIPEETTDLETAQAEAEVALAKANAAIAEANIAKAEAEAEAREALEREAEAYAEETSANQRLAEARGGEDATSRITLKEAQAASDEAAQAREAANKAINIAADSASDEIKAARVAANEFAEAAERAAEAAESARQAQIAQPSERLILPPPVAPEEGLLQPVGFVVPLVTTFGGIILDALGLNPLADLGRRVGIPSPLDIGRNIFSGSSESTALSVPPVSPVPPVAPVPLVESLIVWTGPRVEPQPEPQPLFSVEPQPPSPLSERIEHFREAQDDARQRVDDARTRMTDAEIHLRNAIVSSESSPEELVDAYDRLADARTLLTRANEESFYATQSYLDVLGQSVGRIVPPTSSSLDSQLRTDAELSRAEPSREGLNPLFSAPPPIVSGTSMSPLERYIQDFSTGLSPQGQYTGTVSEAPPTVIVTSEPTIVTPPSATPPPSFSSITPESGPDSESAVTGTQPPPPSVASANRYELYVNGELSFSRDGVDRDRALAHCLQTAEANPSIASIRCTWNGGEIYNNATITAQPGNIFQQIVETVSGVFAPPQSGTLADDYGTIAPAYCPRLSTTFQRDAQDATTNGQVSELQRFLSDYYDIDPEEIISRFFGGITERYVLRFQREQGLPVLGSIDAPTREAIRGACGGGGATLTPVSPTGGGGGTTPSPATPPPPAASSETISTTPPPSSLIVPSPTPLSVSPTPHPSVAPADRYELFINGELSFSRDGVDRDRALVHCLQTAEANPSISIRCTWNGGEIYNRGAASPTSVVPRSNFFANILQAFRRLLE